MPLLIPPKNIVAGDVCILVDPMPEDPWRVVVLAKCDSISSRIFQTGFRPRLLYGKVDINTLSGYDYMQNVGLPLSLHLPKIRILGVVNGRLPLGADDFECIKFMKKVVRQYKQEILR